MTGDTHATPRAQQVRMLGQDTAVLLVQPRLQRRSQVIGALTDLAPEVESYIPRGAAVIGARRDPTTVDALAAVLTERLRGERQFGLVSQVVADAMVVQIVPSWADAAVLTITGMGPVIKRIGDPRLVRAFAHAQETPQSLQAVDLLRSVLGQVLTRNAEARHLVMDVLPDMTVRLRGLREVSDNETLAALRERLVDDNADPIEPVRKPVRKPARRKPGSRKPGSRNPGSRNPGSGERIDRPARPGRGPATSPGPDEPATAGAELETAEPEASGPEASDDSGTPPPPAYPVLRQQGEKADEDLAIASGAEFVLEVGIAPAPDRRQSISGGLGTVRAGEPITIRLAYDPAAFEIAQSTVTVTPTKDDTHPVVPVPVFAKVLDNPTIENRRIAAHFFVDGILRGIAVRTFREAGMPEASTRTSPAVIDLSPLVGEEPPDVVLAVYRADAVTAGSFFVAAFPRDPAVAPPPTGRIHADGGTQGFIADLYRRAEGGGDAYGRYLEIVGAGAEIGGAIPAPIRATLREIASGATKKKPATMLLLTDDAIVPWELAVFPGDDSLESKAGKDSPFLGAHFAIGRWPLNSTSNQTPPPDAVPVDVRATALVTADYGDGVGGWDPLEGAVKEIERLKTTYAPADVWPPLWRDVLRNLESEVDVIHFALHGTYEGRDDEDGLVFIDEKDGVRSLVYVGAKKIAARASLKPKILPNRPFVFVNACQVGRARTNLGNYSGIAASLIAAGARGVVACTWNVDDGVAGSISATFYTQADKGVPVAEIVRAQRARYVVRADTVDAKAPSPTLLAYQYYGHPGLRVIRAR